MNVDETVVKKEDTTEEDPLSDTIQNTTSSTELMDQDPLEVVGAPVKKEEVTEEDPISDTNDLTIEQDPLEVKGDPVKQEKIEDDEQINVKEEREEDHCSDFVAI